jgi:hypothetical protein
MGALVVHGIRAIAFGAPHATGTEASAGKRPGAAFIVRVEPTALSK